MTGPDSFRFLSQERRVGSAGDWNQREWPKLWLYNLHYFDDLVAVDGSNRNGWHRPLISRWIEENPPGRGNGWEPYPTSLRIVNWVKWLNAGNAPVPGMLSSLATQTRWLRQRLEHHLQGNHLWANAKALVFSGACFEGGEAQKWLRDGLDLFSRQIDEQVLEDGGHFELSPMYHAILTEDVLDLVQLAEMTQAIPTGLAQTWRGVAVRMLDWAGTMAHPDGDVSFFNDAALDVAPSLSALREYAVSLGLPMPFVPDVRHLSASGYARLTSGPAVLLADVAPVGPDYLPGHAHADTLSFELSVHQRRVLVNSGTSTYQNEPERLRQRGTAAHNTVVVDGQDSSEVWAAFRVARRARVHDVSLRQEGESLRLSAWHDGYRRLPGRVRHSRCWELRQDKLKIVDQLDGDFDTAEARYLFAPEEALR